MISCEVCNGHTFYNLRSSRWWFGAPRLYAQCSTCDYPVKFTAGSVLVEVKATLPSVWGPTDTLYRFTAR